MRKGILFLILTLALCIIGCSNNQKILECTQNNETTITTIKDGKIIKYSDSNEEETVSREEWETLKNYYEFNGNETTDEIADKLKEFNEKIGYTCKIK